MKIITVGNSLDNGAFNADEFSSVYVILDKTTWDCVVTTIKDKRLVASFDNEGDARVNMGRIIKELYED